MHHEQIPVGKKLATSCCFNSFLACIDQGSTHDGKLAPAGVIQIHEVLPVDHSSPMKRPRAGRAALLGNSP
jgi:hypothetical protein